MPNFRKKPIVVEARRFNQKSLVEQEAIADWCFGLLRGYRLEPEQRIIQIQTLEGEIDASYGDWIIKGIMGEFYPCKPDIFELTYEKVDE